MLALTRKADYALLALTHLARDGRALRSAREIADTYGVPLPILMNILKTLTRSGMVTSVRGARGGYRLAMDPRQISLHMVVRAIDGPVRFFQCASLADHTGGNHKCEHEASCPLSTPARRVSDRLCEFLDQISVSELMQESDTATQPVPVGTNVKDVRRDAAAHTNTQLDSCLSPRDGGRSAWAG